MSDFVVQIQQFGKVTEDQLKLILRKTALDILKKIVERTPVDTGRARGGWTVALNTVPGGSPDGVDPSGSATISDGEAAILRAGLADSIVIVNGVEYIRYLEEGHSKQAPNGMVALTLAEFDKTVQGAARGS
jgi:hypothetical protein